MSGRTDTQPREADLERSLQGAPGGEGPEIFWRAWLPQGDPSAVVVIAHGVAEHSNRYAHVAADLTAGGLAVYALDHRGHGLSEGPRCVLDRMSRAVADVGALIALARGRHPGVPVFLLGHSMGGTIALSHALDHGDEIDGLILSGPVAVLDGAPALLRLIARGLSVVAPRLGILQLDSSEISTDPEVVRAYDEDPLVHSGKIPVRTLAEMSGAIETFPQRLPGLALPVLVMHGEDDSLVPVAASRLVDQLAGGDVTLRLYPGMAHEILNEPGRAEVLDEIKRWIAVR